MTRPVTGLGHSDPVMSTVVSLEAFKAARPARISTLVPNNRGLPPNPAPSDRLVAHRQLMLAFLEQTVVEKASAAGSDATLTG